MKGDNAPPGLRRLFFALWPDEAAREQIGRLVRQLRRETGGRSPAVERLHMTLAYLGDTLEERLGRLREVAMEAVVRPFRLELTRVGSFNQGVVWVGPEVTPEPLLLLAAKLDAELKRAGFRNAQRRFTPHLTLLRDARRPVSLVLDEPIAFDVNEFDLVHSHLPPEPVWYEVIERFALREGA